MALERPRDRSRAKWLPHAKEEKLPRVGLSDEISGGISVDSDGKREWLVPQECV